MKGRSKKVLFMIAAVTGMLSVAAVHAATVEYDASASAAVVTGTAAKVTRIHVKATAPDDTVYYSDFANDAKGDYSFNIPIFKDSMQGIYKVMLSSASADGIAGEGINVSVPGIEGDGYTLEKFKVSGSMADKNVTAEISFSAIDENNPPMAFIAVYKNVTSIKDGTIKENSLVNVAAQTASADRSVSVALPEFTEETSDNTDDQTAYYAKVFLCSAKTIRPIAWSYTINE